jgi:hypothetical protein
MKAKTTVIHASHMSLLSRPNEVAIVIEEAVAAVTAMSIRAEPAAP